MAYLDHIGIAVGDLPRVKKLFEILGMGVTATETVSDQGVKVHFMPFQEGHRGNLELLEVQDPQGPLGKFLDKKGPGIHHLSFLLEKGELPTVSAELEKEKYKLIYDQPRKGAGGMMINFIHPSTTGGILVEIMEKA